MTKPAPMLFLDFDGVLFDTVLEAYVIARRVHEGRPFRDSIDSGHYSRFHAARYLVSHAWHYRIFWLLLEKYRAESTLEALEREYTAYVATGKRDEDTRFEQAYFSARAELMESDGTFWHSLSTPYPFLEDVRSFFSAGEASPYIITTKNGEAVRQSLNSAGIVLELGHLIDLPAVKAAGGKAGAIKALMSQHGAVDAVFVDDNEGNIRECLPVPGLTCFLASWGYVDPKLPSSPPSDIIKHLTTPQ